MFPSILEDNNIITQKYVEMKDIILHMLFNKNINILEFFLKNFLKKN